jgi:hypothetical protein
MKYILPNPNLTVIIRNDSPMIHCGDSPTYRSVRIVLTDEQVKQLKLKYTDSTFGQDNYEVISKCFMEP